MHPGGYRAHLGDPQPAEVHVRPVYDDLPDSTVVENSTVVKNPGTVTDVSRRGHRARRSVHKESTAGNDRARPENKESRNSRYGFRL